MKRNTIEWLSAEALCWPGWKAELGDSGRLHDTLNYLEGYSRVASRELLLLSRGMDICELHEADNCFVITSVPRFGYGA